jgi:hypothetical protein
MNLKQSSTDLCIFYKRQGKMVALILVLYVDDTLCAGERKEVQWSYKKIEENIKIVTLGKLKKHLGIAYDWKQDKLVNTYFRSFNAKDDRRYQ